MTQENNTIDCTPTWAAVASVYITVLSNPDASFEGRAAAIAEIHQMAHLADRYNQLLRAQRSVAQPQPAEPCTAQN